MKFGISSCSIFHYTTRLDLELGSLGFYPGFKNPKIQKNTKSLA